MEHIQRWEDAPRRMHLKEVPSRTPDHANGVLLWIEQHRLMATDPERTIAACAFAYDNAAIPELQRDLRAFIEELAGSARHGG